MRNKQSHKGFTLVEILITLLIVSVGMLALGSFFASSIRQESLAQERIAAVHLAEQIIEDWQRTNTLPAPACTVAGKAAGVLTIGTVVNNCVASNGVPVSFSIVINQTPATAPLPTGHPNNPNASGPGAVVVGTLLTGINRATAPFEVIAGSPPVMVRIVNVSWQQAGKSYNVFLTHIRRFI